MRLQADLKRVEIHGADHCSLRCSFCNHLSPQLTKKRYGPEDYAPWLEMLKAGGCTWLTTCISGGEPFVNKQIVELARMARQYGTYLEIVSNCFWLKSEASIDKYADLWPLVDLLVVSRYKPYENEDRSRLLELLGRRVRIGSNQGDVVETFFAVEFVAEKLPVVENNCAVKDCTQLRSNGTLYRCVYGYATEVEGAVPSGVDMTDMVYDIEHDTRPLREWASKWPLSCCTNCTLGQGRQVPFAWREDK